MATRDDVEALPFSCSTNLSKEVLAHLARAHLGSGAWDFCAVLHNHTFGNAGWHRQNGHREIWCPFDLAAWAAELGSSRSNLQRVLNELQTCHIIVYTPDLHMPGTGRIGWNIHFEDWQPYDGRRAKTRSAAACQKQAPILILPVATGADASAPTEQTAVVEPDAPPAARSPRKINMDACRVEDEPRKISMAGRSEPRKINMPACFKINMDASFETSLQASPPDPLRKGTKERATEESAKAPSAASGRSSSSTRGFCWPERLEGERELDFYQRLLKEAGENNAVKLLMQLAFEKLGVALEHANYGRMTILARKHRAAMMVRHILHAAGDHIDQDPMNYLTWLANGKQREGGTNGHTGTTRTHRETYQPRAAGVAGEDSTAGGHTGGGDADDGWDREVVHV